MIYKSFLLIMGFLTDKFGYENALVIKDLLDNWSGIAEGMLILIVLFSYFIMDVNKYKGLEPEATIVRVEHEGVKSMQINPRSRGEVIRIIIGWVMMKFSPNLMTSISTRAARPLTIIILVLLVFLFLLGTLLSMWHYLPNGDINGPIYHGKPQGILKLLN